MNRKRNCRSGRIASGVVSGLALGLLPGFAGGAAHGGVINVPADFAVIQNAINSAADGDEIVVAPGVYNEHITFQGKAITLRSQNVNQPGLTTINGTANGIVVKFDNGEGRDSVLSGFTLTNGASPLAGGIYVGPSADPAISKCIVSNCLANNGGGMAVYGNVSCTRVTFVGNIANVSGGGAYGAPGSLGLTLDACRFQGDDAPAGAGLAINGPAIVTNAEVFDNVNGPAVNVNGVAPVQLINDDVVANAGAGIVLAAAAVANLNIDNCVVRNNAAQIVGPAAHLVVRYSNVQGGFAGPGNINVNPLFVNPALGDFRLQPASPCIDAGENATVPLNVKFDFDGSVRFFDKPDIADTGAGVAPIVDIGAHEFPPPRRYVNVDATGANNGRTWDSAYNDLQDALDEAALAGSDIEEIWVAAGAYKPDRGTGNRALSFQMLDDVSIIGGFTGVGETDASENDPAANQTVLGGAIGGPGETDNSYHVVEAINVNGNGKLIGFIVQKGYADGGGADSQGGGIYIDGGAPAIRECWVRQNHSLSNGAGLCSVQGDPDIIRDRFNLNTSDFLGGGVSLLDGSPRVINCFVSGNEAFGATGIHVGDLASAEIANCTVVGNTTLGGQCGGIVAEGALAASNNIVWNNTGSGPSVENKQLLVVAPFGSAAVDYCTIEGWTGGLGGTLNNGADPHFADADGPDDSYGTADDDVRLDANSPCIDSADAAALPGFVNTDLDGFDRFEDDVNMPNFGSGSPAYLDRGAYEFSGASCRGDIDGNEVVDIDDLFAVINAWGACAACLTDINGNGLVDIDDLFDVINHWGVCPP